MTWTSTPGVPELAMLNQICISVCTVADEAIDLHMQDRWSSDDHAKCLFCLFLRGNLFRVLPFAFVSFTEVFGLSKYRDKENV